MQLGATLVDGFEVSSIQEEGGVVTVTGADNVAYSAPSLGDVMVPILHASMSTCTSSVSWTLGQRYPGQDWSQASPAALEDTRLLLEGQGT